MKILSFFLENMRTQGELDRRKMAKEVAEKGGIDLNPSYLELKRTGDVIDMQVISEGESYGNISIDGLVPVILNIQPVTDLPLLLGLKEDAEGVLGMSDF